MRRLLVAGLCLSLCLPAQASTARAPMASSRTAPAVPVLAPSLVRPSSPGAPMGLERGISAVAQAWGINHAVAQGRSGAALERTFDNAVAPTPSAVLGFGSGARLAAGAAAWPAARLLAPPSPALMASSFGSVWAPVLVMIAVSIALTIYLQRRNSGGGPRLQGGGLLPQANVAQKVDSHSAKVTFADIAGLEEAKHEFEKVIRRLKHPQIYRALHPRSKGFNAGLMIGPPGTGKTLLAEAVAGEADANFLTASGSDFIEELVGTGAKRVRALFEQGRALSKANGKPTIIFIDEIDAVGKIRSGVSRGGGDSEHDQTLNALLAEIDGFHRNENIFLLASTNRPDTLDPALMRGRRFGLKVPVGMPDIVQRKAIFEVKMRDMALAGDIDLDALAKVSAGLSGADIEDIVEDATQLAGDRITSDIDAQLSSQAANAGKEGKLPAPPKAVKVVDKDGKPVQVTQADFIRAVDRAAIGHERKIAMNEEEKTVVAYHEGGHAVVAHYLPWADPIKKTTIVPHGLNSLGLMQSMPEEDRYLQSREYLVERMAVAMGGRAAEELSTGIKFSGAQNDFEQATRIARYMVMKFGMSEKIGEVSYDLPGEPPKAGAAMSEAKNAEIEAEVKRLTDDAMALAKKILLDHQEAYRAFCAELRAKETLREEDTLRLLGPKSKPPSLLSRASDRIAHGLLSWNGAWSGE